MTSLRNSLSPSAYQSLQRELAERLIAKALARPNRDLETPDGIVWFVRNVLRADPTDYQIDVLRNLVLHKRAAVRGPHGLGKTAMASWVILWGFAALGDDVKVPVTASAWRQLTHFTFPEVKKWALKADWSKVGLDLRYGREILEQSLKLPGREAFPVASDNPALIDGAHARKIVYVFDEAKAIQAGTFDAAEGAFSNAGADTAYSAYALAISTPGDTGGRFYDIHKRRPGYDDWWVRHVTLGEAIAAGRVSREWAEQRRRQWGENSPVYINRVLGEFAEAGTDVLIPLAWVDQANDRWQERDGRGTGEVRYGVDVARYGDDSTTIGRLVGSTLESLDYLSQKSTMETTGEVILRVKDKTIHTLVDVIGIGAGVVDRLREQGYNVTGVNVGESAKDDYGRVLTDESGELKFANLRSLIWWMLRERLDPNGVDPLALPLDDRLTGDLTAPKWTVTSSGTIKVESKDEIRKRIGRSTDAADALGLALYGERKRKRPMPRPVVIETRRG